MLPRVDVMPDTATILLVRHAESEANAAHDAPEGDTDSPLSARGRAQALALAYAFERTDLTAIYCSDTRRATATVARIASKLGCGPITTPSLREPYNASRATEVMDPAAAAAFLERIRSGGPRAASRPTETHAELVARLRAFLDGCLPLAVASTIVVASHFATLNVLLRLLTEAAEPPPGLWTHFDNASVTRVDVGVHGSPPVGVIRYANWRSEDVSIA
jgi:broad specificity phosphatase PhoE